MKLPELKEKLRNRYTVKIIAGVLVIALAAGGIGTTVYSVNAQNNTVAETEATEDNAEEMDLDGILDHVSINTEGVGKEESVYVITDATGNAQEVIVSGHLYNRDKATTLSDETNLKELENVKGDETFTQNGNKVTWQAAGKDIYYQGKTTQAVPLKQHVTYKLDGKEITPEELAGKSGKVTIRFDYENTTNYTENVNGEDVSVKVPLAAVSTVMLNENFYNVEVSNGKIKENGSSNIVVGYALPGLKESLDVDEEKLSDVNIPDYFEITADVDNFELKTAMTFVINGTEFVSMTGSMTDNIDDIVDDLSDATDKLVDGSGDLASGADKLANGAGELANGADALESGLGKMQSSLEPFIKGMGSLKTGVEAYIDGATKINDGIKSLYDGTESLTDGVNTINASAHSISAGIAALDTTLTTPMSDEEKQSTGSTAAAAAVAQVQGKISTSDIKAQAEAAYKNTMTSAESVNALASSLMANPQLTASIAAAVQETVAAQIGESNILAFQNANDGIGRAAAVKAIYNANGGDFDALVNGTISNQVSGMAAAILSGLADSSAPAVGSSVAGAVSDASVTVAKEVAYTVAIQTVEQTKATVAAGIEAEQDNGYSLVTGSRALSDGTQALTENVPTLTAGVAQLLAGSNQLVANNDALLEGMNNLSEGSGKIKEGVDKLATGSVDLSKGANKLKNGAFDLATGADKLSNGMVEFNDEGISKIVNAYDGDLKPLATRLQAVVDAGNSYQSFTGISEGTKGSVKFIYKLGAIEANK